MGPDTGEVCTESFWDRTVSGGKRGNWKTSEEGQTRDGSGYLGSQHRSNEHGERLTIRMNKGMRGLMKQGKISGPTADRAQTHLGGGEKV